MAEPQTESLLAEVSLDERGPPELFRSSEEVSATSLTGYTHILRRVWKSFDDLIGVLAISGRPTVYLQYRPSPEPITPAEQQRFWSNGVAPLLVRITPREVQVYSSLRSPALAGEDVNADKRLVDAFGRATQALEIRNFIRSVEAGTVYDHYAEHFDPAQAIDRRLVENLRAARKLMASGTKAPDLPSIHRLLGRVLFTCYLEARGALVDRDFGRLGAGPRATFRDILSLAEPGLVRAALARLFHRLGRYFRGNLFEDLDRDLKAMRDEDLVTLRMLIRGDDLGTGQMVLPFYVYDFSVIPIETISAVYEDFIRAEDSQAQRKKGAYYTPPKLVGFTMDLATEGQTDLTGKRVLDPGCGSGVFLVSAFNQLAENWVRHHEHASNGTRARALAKILREQICGVDVSVIACQATCFSLYMAMLDFLDPREIRRLGRERLPSLFLEGAEKPRSNGPQTVIQGDFLSALPALESQSFDLVVGNPPWVARRNVEKNVLTRWQKTHPPGDFPIPANQLACAFLWEAPRYLKPGGHACLVLPAGVLLGDQTDAFQVKWFQRHQVEKIAHLSDLRFFLFPGADHPTIVIRFQAGSAPPTHRFEYLTPRAARASLCDNVLKAEPDDRKILPLEELLLCAERDQAATFWLSYNWASPRDREFLIRLRSLPELRELVGEPNEVKRWVKGQGFQPAGRADVNPKKPFWQPDHPFLSAKHQFDVLLFRADTKAIGRSLQALRRVPDERLFKAPLVVFNKGFSNIAFGPFDVLFRHALQGISGPESDKNLLMFLTATLLSPLAKYFVFHLSSKPIYRGNPLLNEVLRIPFPLPEDAPGFNPAEAVRAVAETFARVANDHRFCGLGHDQLIRDAKHEISRHVYSYFDVSNDEEILIEDAVETLEGSATPSRSSYVPTLAMPTVNVRHRYADTLISALSRWAGGKVPDLATRSVVSDEVGVAVLTIQKATDPVKYRETRASPEFEQVLSRLKAVSPERYGSLVYLRNLVVLEPPNCMHLVKPLTMRFWLRSAALNDADAVAAHLLRRTGRIKA